MPCCGYYVKAFLYIFETEISSKMIFCRMYENCLLVTSLLTNIKRMLVKFAGLIIPPTI